MSELRYPMIIPCVLCAGASATAATCAPLRKPRASVRPARCGIDGTAGPGTVDRDVHRRCVHGVAAKRFLGLKLNQSQKAIAVATPESKLAASLS